MIAKVQDMTLPEYLQWNKENGFKNEAYLISRFEWMHAKTGAEKARIWKEKVIPSSKK